MNSDDMKKSASEKMLLGGNYFTAGDRVKALELWESITREDDAKVYAFVRYNLGTMFLQEGDVPKAHEYLESITREDDAQQYANARYNLGIFYCKKGDISEARKYLESITREDYAQAYANARYNLGTFYCKKGDISEARKYLESITRKDDAQQYAKARFNLGVSYYKEGNIAKAHEYWESIAREDYAQAYANARYNLGNFYLREGDISTARQYWESITREDDVQHYLKAQHNLGGMYSGAGDISTARKYWESITREDDAEIYANARLNLGGSYYEEGDVTKACEYWESIHRKDDAATYVQAQFELGNIYFKEEKVKEAQSCWRNLLQVPFLPKTDIDDNKWLFYITQKINLFCSANDNKIEATDLFKLLNSLKNSENSIRNKLYMHPDLFKDEAKKYVNFQKLEIAFAHYTRAEIAEKIIEKGSFHLGVSNYMNDPTEGKILLNEWNIPADYNKDWLCFLTSFTFNENSLNQFRLYGKEGSTEGSGVSLVVANTFFDFHSNNLQYMNTSLLYQDVKQGNNNIQIENIIKKLSKPLPLFRCIYFDQKTNHISVAHQSKSSFRSKRSDYLEEDKIENQDIDEVWEKVWGIYIARMDTITKNVKKELEQILQTINNIRERIEQKGIVHQNEMYEAIATTLLPIIYLTKHAAFEEEVECRILYVTSIFDKVIQRDGDRIYVEYKTELADQYQQDGQSQNYLERIYLGPKADPRAELNLKKCWIDKMREKGMANNEIKIPTIIKSDMPLA